MNGNWRSNAVVSLEIGFLLEFKYDVTITWWLSHWNIYLAQFHWSMGSIYQNFRWIHLGSAAQLLPYYYYWIVRLTWALKRGQMEEHGKTMGKKMSHFCRSLTQKGKIFACIKLNLPFLLVILSWLEEPPHNRGKAKRPQWKGWSCHGTNCGVLFSERDGCDILHDHWPCLRFPDM
jgi:hypothetical protein